MQNDLKSFLRRILHFLLMPLVLYLPYLPFAILFGQKIMERAKGPDAETQLVTSFENALSRDYELLLLGNSRIYRGLNPDKFSIPTFNFGCDNESFNQMYYKLKWLRDHGRSISYVGLGIDYFQFGVNFPGRNYLYARYFDDAYFADYPDEYLSAERAWLNRMTRTLNPKYLIVPDESRPFIRPNGQYIRPGTASPTDSVVRDTERLPLQIHYFKKILADCQEHGTKVFLCLLPVRTEELRCYKEGEIEEYMSFISSFLNDDTILLDFTRSGDYTMADYTDITHFNEKAADRFSHQLSHAMQMVIDGDVSGLRIAEGPLSERK